MIVIGGTAGTMPQAPLVAPGYHYRPPAAFSSLTASANILTQSTTFIGSLESLSLATSRRRSAEARRGTRSERAARPRCSSAVDQASAHGLPDVGEIILDLFFAVQRPTRSASPSRRATDQSLCSRPAFPAADLNGGSTCSSLAFFLARCSSSMSKPPPIE